MHLSSRSLPPTYLSHPLSLSTHTNALGGFVGSTGPAALRCTTARFPPRASGLIVINRVLLSHTQTHT